MLTIKRPQIQIFENQYGIVINKDKAKQQFNNPEIMQKDNQRIQDVFADEGIKQIQLPKKVEEDHNQMRNTLQIKHQDSIPHQGVSPNDNRYYFGKESNCFVRGLSLHFFSILPAYFTHFSNRQLIDYRPEYQSMVTNNYLWHRYRNSSSKFDLLKELFLAEKGPIITMTLFSIIIGLLALAGAYFQRFLFAQLTDPTFPTSGWVYFGLIMGSTLIRFFLFNWVQNIANQSAINIRCYMQNALVKTIFYAPKHMSEGLLINNLYLSADGLRMVVKLIPYFVMSFVIVFGIVGFIIAIIGPIGCVVIGLIILMLVIQFCMLKTMLHWHHQSVRAADKRAELLLLCTENLMKLAKSGEAKTYFMMMDDSRRQETQIDMKYNAFDGLIEVLIEFVSFLSVFIFYVVSQSNLRNSGESYPNYRQIFQTVIMFSVFKTPIKMLAYCLSIGLDGHAALTRLQKLFDEAGFIPPVTKDQSCVRVYPDPSIFQSVLHVKAQQANVNTGSQSNAPYLLDHPNYKGKMVMILGKLDANPSCDSFIKNIQENLPFSIKYYKIESDAMIEDKSIRENIVMGEYWDAKRYTEILQLLNLKQTLEQFPEGDETQMHQNYFKTIYAGLELKIELARALYCNVDLLIINRLIFKEYETILRQVKDYRNFRKQTTLIVNLSGSYYDIADWLIVLGKNGQKEEGTYEQLKTVNKSANLQQFQSLYQIHQKFIEKQQKRTKSIANLVHKLEQEPIDAIEFKFTHFFRFYSLNHFGAPILLVIVLLLSPLIELYMEIIVTNSAKIWQQNNEPDYHATSQTLSSSATAQHKFDHIITLRYGLTILLLLIINIAKILVFSAYLRNSAYMIVRRMANKLFSNKIQEMLSSSNRRNALNLQVNIENIDTKITADLDLGMTIIFQQVTAVIFGAVRSLLFLAIGFPFLIVTFLIITITITFNRKILAIRLTARSKLNSFIKKLLMHRQAYLGLKKTKYISKEFIKYNKADVMADLNQEWMMEALGIILEIGFILLLLITMVVSLTSYSQIHTSNPAFLELSISFIIGLTNGGRINLKIFQALDGQLVGITSMFKLIDKHKNERKRKGSEMSYLPQQSDNSLKKVNQSNLKSSLPFPEQLIIECVRFHNFYVRFKDDILKGINLPIKRGERIVVTGSRRGGKRVAIYSMLGIFEKKHTRGDIELNNQFSIYKDDVPRQLISNMIHVLDGGNYGYLESKTIEESIKMSIPDISPGSIENILKQIWGILQFEPLFNMKTNIQELSSPERELFSLLRALLLKPEILVIEGGFNCIDGGNRRKLTKWLISNQNIPILLDLTNRIEVIGLYKRRLHFEDGKLTRDEQIQ